MLLARYILRFHLGPFLFGTLTVMFIFLMQFLIINIDKLLGKGLEPMLILQVITYSLAWMVVLAVPMGVLFSTLMAFGNMAAAQEITIIKSTGISLIKMMFPVMLCGAGIFYGMYRFNNDVLPDTNHAFKVLMQDIQRKKPTFAIESGQFSTQLEGFTILSRKTDSTGILYGMTVYDYQNPARTNVLTADTGRVRFSSDYSNIILDLSSGEIHQVNKINRGDYRHITFSKHQVVIPARDFLFERSENGVFSRGDREMNIAAMEEQRSMALANKHRFDSLITHELQRFVNSQDKPLPLPSIDNEQELRTFISQSDGLRSAIDSYLFQRDSYRNQANQYEVEIHKKYAIPMACFLLVFIGAPLGIVTRRGNFGVSAAISLGFYIFYWAMLIMGEKLADRNHVSPAVGMWGGNVIIAIVGIILTLRTNYESLPLLSALWKRK